VVCSNIPDIRTLVQEYEIGRVLRREGADEIARVVSEMLADDGLERMRENTARASRELCWEREAERLLDVFERTTRARDGGRVCFIARKDLTINSRARRIVDTLTSNGYDVTVVGGKVPDVGSPYRVPNVEYIAVGIT
jgi:hypothetical protein